MTAQPAGTLAAFDASNDGKGSERTYRSFFDYLPAAAYSCDGSGLITHYNTSAVELWGRRPKLNDPAERYDGSLRLYNVDGTPIPHDECWMAKALRSGGGFNACEKIIERPDGERRHVLAHANPIVDDTGRVIGGINVLVDITDQRRAEHQAREQAIAAERLIREQHALRQAIASMEQVLGVVGHELRTPLAAVRAISEFLTADGADQTPEYAGFLHNLSAEVDRMSDTLNNILEAARLNSGRARWNWGVVDLATILGDAAETIRPLLDTAKVNLVVADRVEGDAFSGGMMRGDAEAIRRLLLNLLSNARKHTAAGAIEVSCRAIAEPCGAEWVELTVRDTGSGIPPAVLERLGEAFALNAGVVGANGCHGTGLGLAICRGIVRAHGGTLRVAETGPNGTTIVARLRADLIESIDGNTTQLHSDVASADLLAVRDASASTETLERLCI